MRGKYITIEYMNGKIRDYVGIALIVAMLVVAAAAWQFVAAYSAQIEPSSFRSFSVSGEGKVVAVPDIATFTFSVITEGGNAIGMLAQQNTDKVNKAIAFVKGEGVDAKDITTQNYDLSPRYQYYDCRAGVNGGATACPPPTIVGYTITQRIQVKVRDFAKIGDIFSGVVTNGANSVSQLSFTIDDPTSVKNQARAQAIAKAKAEAQAIADAGGFTLGKLLAINTNASMPPVPMYALNQAKSAIGMGGSADMAAPSIEPGSQDVVEDVTLKYEIK